MDLALALRSPSAMTLARGTREIAVVRAQPLAAPALPVIVIQQLVVELHARALPVAAGPSVRLRRALAAYAEPPALRPLLAIG